VHAQGACRRRRAALRVARDDVNFVMLGAFRKSFLCASVRS
jgi:hypothetical protein